jgi:hypothetical protein
MPAADPGNLFDVLGDMPENGFTSTEVVYGVSDTDVTDLPECGVAVMRGGHLAILRSDSGATKESEVAAGDIVPVNGAQFEKTLAAASTDVLREMVRQFVQRMMDAEVEVRCGAAYGEEPARLRFMSYEQPSGMISEMMAEIRHVP